MKFTTIWTMPATPFAERLRRTGDWITQKIAAALPKRIRYWVFIQMGCGTMHPDEVVPDVTYVELLGRVEGGPR